MSDPVDPLQLRASHEDRECVVEVLQAAAAEGRIEIDELHERLEAAWRARTWGELDRLVADLPGARLPWHGAAGPAAVVPVRPPGPLEDDTLTISAPMTNQRRDGVWEVPSRIVLEPSVGSITLDLRRATCRHRRVHLDVHGGVGNVVLVVGPGWSVDSSALRTGWGSARQRLDRDDAPAERVLVVTGGIGMGTFVARRPRFYER